MMKNGFIFLFILVIVAKFTVPNSSKLHPYLEKKGKAEGLCNPLFGNAHFNYLIFTVDKVRYCETLPVSVPVAEPDSVTSNGLTKLNRLRPLPAIRKPVRTDTYLGLFGTYWKIN